MKRILAILLSLIFNFAYGQSMLDILRKLPDEPVPHTMIDSLMKNGVYYLPDNSEEEAVKYSLTQINDTLGTLRIDMSYETGQRGFGITALRRFKVKKDEFLIIYSSITGAPIAFEQGELLTYQLKKGQITKNSHSLLPKDIGLRDFVKPNTPDSVLTKYAQYSNHAYDLIYSGENICYVLHEDFEFYGIDKYWLLGNRIEFLFEKGKFKKLSPSFRED